MKEKIHIRPKGTFNNEPALTPEKCALIGEVLSQIITDKNLLVATVARASGLHAITIGRIKNLKKPFTQTVFNKLLNGLGMTEKEFFEFNK